MSAERLGLNVVVVVGGMLQTVWLCLCLEVACIAAVNEFEYVVHCRAGCRCHYLLLLLRLLIRQRRRPGCRLVRCSHALLLLAGAIAAQDVSLVHCRHHFAIVALVVFTRVYCILNH